MKTDVLIVGGGVAGAACAATLRTEGFAGSVVLAGRELDPPYHRPPATKDYLRGTGSKEAARFPLPGDVDVRTRTGVAALDLEARTATLQSKEELTWDKLLIATGAMVRRLPLAGADLDGVHYIRALGNADSIRRDLGEEGARRVVCIGGSFIGCEVAATLTALGHECTLVLQEATTMERALGTTLGRRVQGVLEEHGVRVMAQAEVERLDGDEQVERAVLAGGGELAADLVVIGAGAIPDVTLARKAGLPIGRRGGVECNAELETEVGGVFAAGDMCEYDSVLHGGPVRIEHEAVAIGQGVTVARNMLGAGAPYEDVPYFWSDLADWLSVHSVGSPDGWDEEERQGEDTVLFKRDGRIVGAATVSARRELRAAERVLRERASAV